MNNHSFWILGVDWLCQPSPDCQPRAGEQRRLRRASARRGAGVRTSWSGIGTRAKRVLSALSCAEGNKLVGLKRGAPNVRSPANCEPTRSAYLFRRRAPDARQENWLICREGTHGCNVGGAPLPEAVMNRSSSIKDKFAMGCRIEVKSSAGPRLSGKTGTVVGIGYHPESLRIVLDGSKSPITLHFTYLVVVNK